MRLVTAASVAFLLSLVGCTKSQPTSRASPAELAANLKARGRAVYLSNCTSCHAVDPKLDGSVGPAIFGSSLELITARVMKASYPPGYKPKRPTSVMPALPHLEKDIPALAAYLGG
jgi:mono/diheme cytochrome c family protein